MAQLTVLLDAALKVGSLQGLKDMKVEILWFIKKDVRFVRQGLSALLGSALASGSLSPSFLGFQDFKAVEEHSQSCLWSGSGQGFHGRRRRTRKRSMPASGDSSAAAFDDGCC